MPTYLDVSILVSWYFSEAEGGDVTPHTEGLGDASTCVTGIHQVCWERQQPAQKQCHHLVKLSFLGFFLPQESDKSTVLHASISVLYTEIVQQWFISLDILLYLLHCKGDTSFSLFNIITDAVVYLISEASKVFHHTCM